MPAVNRDLMYQAMLRETKGPDNQLLYWSKLLDWKNQTLTPNTDVIYLTPYFDTKVWAGCHRVSAGSRRDHRRARLWMPGRRRSRTWDQPGLIKGRAGSTSSSRRAIPPKCPTGTSFCFIDVQRLCPVASIRQSAATRIWPRPWSTQADQDLPLVEADNPPPTTCVDAARVLNDATIPYDIRFFESLDRVIQHEPWLERDRAMIDTLRTLGIEKGKKFAPDARDVQALNTAASKRTRTSKGSTTSSSPKGRSQKKPLVLPRADGARLQSGPGTVCTAQLYPVEDRGLLLSFIFFLPKRLGEGQFLSDGH